LKRALPVEDSGCTPICFMNACIVSHGQMPKEEHKTIRVEFEVTFLKVNGDYISKTFNLDIPIELELNYSDDAFKKWAKSVYEMRKSIQVGSDLMQVSEIMAKYGITPRLHEDVLREIRTKSSHD